MYYYFSIYIVNNIEEKVIYENEMKYFKGKGLFEIPTFNKELLYYNWDNM